MGKEIEETKIDVFAEALKESISVDAVVVTGDDVSLPAVKRTRKNWSELKTAIDNEHAHRFNDILNNLPDREFTRIYLKALEFFKPKVIRQAGARGEVIDQTINIQINYGDKR